MCAIWLEWFVVCDVTATESVPPHEWHKRDSPEMSGDEIESASITTASAMAERRRPDQNWQGIVTCM